MASVDVLPTIFGNRLSVFIITYIFIFINTFCAAVFGFGTKPDFLLALRIFTDMRESFITVYAG